MWCLDEKHKLKQNRNEEHQCVSHRLPRFFFVVTHPSINTTHLLLARFVFIFHYPLYLVHFRLFMFSLLLSHTLASFLTSWHIRIHSLTASTSLSSAFCPLFLSYPLVIPSQHIPSLPSTPSLLHHHLHKTLLARSIAVLSPSLAPLLSTIRLAVSGPSLWHLLRLKEKREEGREGRRE